MIFHDAHGIAGILNGIERAAFNEDGTFRDTFRTGRVGHDFSFNETLSGGSAGKNDARRHATLVLSHSFQNARKLLRCGIAVGVGGRAEHNDGVKTGKGRV